jgi:hypothetical protein
VGHESVALAAAVIAVAAAVRSAWSPCSLSMLSMLTPFGESGRGNRFAVSATAFVVGTVAGGVCLGLIPAGLALAIHAADIGEAQLAAAIVAATLLSLAGDVGLLPTPHIPRQVNESWFGQYRAWVYGVGYGWQLGAGLTTYVMTTAVYLMLVVAALTGSVAAAVAICAGFGTLRGLTILLAVRVRNPDAMRALHDRLDSTEPISRGLAVAAQVAVAAFGVAAIASVWVTAAATAALLVVAVVSLRTMPSRSASAA